MCILNSEFRTRFPEFSNVEDLSANKHLASAMKMCDPDFWGNFHEMAVCNLAAHFMLLPPDQELVHDGKAADQPSEFCLIQVAKAQYEATPYGQKYLALLFTLSGVK